MKENQKHGQKYEKPKLRAIDLTADEVLAVGCKTHAGGGPATPTCAVRKCAGVIKS
ncbi:MAG: hypothetical protein RDU01_00725 [Thermodesulfovibrionales bacterium]|nr:hypothetical protein [Thermodesulfovibrionales bacterium]